MRLVALPALVGTSAVCSVVAHCQKVSTKALDGDVSQSLSHSERLPLGAQEQRVLLRFAESTLPLVGRSWSRDMDVGSLFVGSWVLPPVWLLGCPPLHLWLWILSISGWGSRQSFCMITDKGQQLVDRRNSLLLLGMLLPQRLQLGW